MTVTITIKAVTRAYKTWWPGSLCTSYTCTCMYFWYIKGIAKNRRSIWLFDKNLISNGSQVLRCNSHLCPPCGDWIRESWSTEHGSVHRGSSNSRKETSWVSASVEDWLEWTHAILFPPTQLVVVMSMPMMDLTTVAGSYSSVNKMHDLATTFSTIESNR